VTRAERDKIVDVMARAISPSLPRAYSGTNPDVDDQHNGRTQALSVAKGVLVALESAGVRLAPSETTEAMSDAFFHALNHAYPDHRKDRQSKNQGWTMQSEFIWQAFMSASPYAKEPAQ
jgi:hypothetical protein